MFVVLASLFMACGTPKDGYVVKGSLKNGFLLFFLRSVSPVPRNTQGIILYTWELLIPYRCP